MTTDESLLEEMLKRSTNPSDVEVDNMAVQIFCLLVNSNKDGLVEKAQQLIVDKIKSSNTTEADKAIGKEGGVGIKQEVNGKEVIVVTP